MKYGIYINPPDERVARIDFDEMYDSVDEAKKALLKKIDDYNIKLSLVGKTNSNTCGGVCDSNFTDICILYEGKWE